MGFLLLISNVRTILPCILLLTVTVTAKQAAIKIVEEPTNYGLNFGGYQNEEESHKLQMRIQPSNFSGPPHLKLLEGKCFSSVLESYKYEFCPFANITQHEQSLRWNPYSGVLGVWQEWEIVNNTFLAMLMSEGDACGSLGRSTKVFLKCGDRQAITKVTEPDTCQYEMEFSTSLVCHPHSLLVYPTLSDALQREWGLIEGQLQAEEITQQGYHKLLHKVYEKAGYVIPEDVKKKVAAAAKKKEAAEAKTHEDTFDTLSQCQTEYNKLKETVEALRTVLRVNGLPDEVPDNNKEISSQEDQFPQDPYRDYQWLHEEEYKDF